MRYIVVGNSLYKTFSKIYKYQEGDYFIGLDEGSLEIIKNNYTLNEAWGDFDSGNNIELIKSKANKFKKYPKEKRFHHN
jgi:thiamine pyrophosphokinase